MLDFIFRGRSAEDLPRNKKGLLESSPSGRAVLLAIEHVHRDFKAKAHFGVFGFGPHSKAPL
jgi:hypothetical protein